MVILQYFEHVIYSRDIPARLAQTESWPEVTHQLGVAPASIAFVSHHRRLLEPAAEHGLNTFAYQCAPAKADRYVSHLSEIPYLSRPIDRAQAA